MTRITAWSLSVCENANRRSSTLLVYCFFAASIQVTTCRAQYEKLERPLGRLSTPSLASYVPRRELLLYLESKGFDAQAEAWNKTAACRLLAETKVSALLEEMAIQAIGAYQEAVPTQVAIRGVDAVGALKRVAHRGFVLALFGRPPHQMRYSLLLNGGDQPEFEAILQALADSRATDPETTVKPASIKIAGRTLHRFSGDQVWWLEKGTLILTGRPSADEILEVIEGHQPSAIDHALRTEAFLSKQGFEPIVAGFFDAAGLGPLSPEFAQLGLGSLKRIELRWGFDQDALIGTLRVVAHCSSLRCTRSRRPAELRHRIASSDPPKRERFNRNVNRSREEHTT